MNTFKCWAAVSSRSCRCRMWRQVSMQRRKPTRRARRASRRAIMMRRLLRSMKPSGWTRSLPRRIVVEAVPTGRRVNTTSRLWIAPRPSIWTRSLPGRITNAVWPIMSGEYDKAIADYTEAIHLDPTDAQAYNNRGIAYVDKSDLDNAIADHTTAIRLGPEQLKSGFRPNYRCDDLARRPGRLLARKSR